MLIFTAIGDGGNLFRSIAVLIKGKTGGARSRLGKTQ